MSRKCLVLDALLSDASNKRKLRRALFGVVLLILALISTTQPIPARAAPPAQTGVPHFRLVYVPPRDEPLCAGKSYSFGAKLEQYYEDPSNSRTHEQLNRYLTGRTIEAFANPASVGTVSPAHAITGWTGVLEGGSPLNAEFSFNAKKPGTATIFLEASSPYGEYVSLNVPVTVKGCKYSVRMNYQWRHSGSDLRAWTFGQLSTTIEGQADQYQGSGTFNFLEGIVLPGSGCTIKLNGFQSQTTITGHMDNDNLQLNFTYTPGHDTQNYTCNPGGSGSKQVTNNVSSVLKSNATFPSGGGSKTYRTPGEGAAPGTPGRLTITVKPIGE